MGKSRKGEKVYLLITYILPIISARAVPQQINFYNDFSTHKSTQLVNSSSSIDHECQKYIVIIILILIQNYQALLRVVPTLKFLLGWRLFQWPRPVDDGWFVIVCDCRDVLWLWSIAVLFSLWAWTGVWGLKNMGGWCPLFWPNSCLNWAIISSFLLF